MKNLRRALACWLGLSLFLGMLTPTTTLLAQTAKPTSVTIAGTVQSKLGCPADWKPECPNSYLTYNAANDLWQATFQLPAGDYEYKAAINNAWDENYGLNAASGGGNISLKLAQAGAVKFYYDHKTHWVTNDKATPIATVIGNFQTKLGCSADNKPDCLRSWLQNPKGDGIYGFTTNALPVGEYQAKVAINESLDETYGVAGAKGGAAVAFKVPYEGAALNFRYEASTHNLTIGLAQQGSFDMAQAQWVAKDTIAWKVEGSASNKYQLHYDAAGALKLNPTGVTGGKALNLSYDAAGLGQKILAKFPQLKDYTALKIAAADQANLAEILKGQMAISAIRGTDTLLNATTLQIPGVLDELYTYNGALGVIYEGTVPTLKLWAPTARSVKAYIYDDTSNPTENVVTMTADTATGVWTAVGKADWTNKFYLYEVEVFVPATGKLERNLVSDPYSVSLSANSRRSQIVNLNDPALAPANWATFKKPALAAPEDIVLYELHVRDFSISDQTVSAANRGTFLAFTEATSNGMKHLKNLATAGLTHIHLLPAFDFATVNEVKAERKEPDATKLTTQAVSEDQQTAIKAIADVDGFNWGYDPLHYMTPEGSYSTNPDGSSRIKEFRQMVQSLSDNGLRVVMDVVLNHTSASGQDKNSVLDRIVPGYYQRLNADGKVENSTCCANTASEHTMMEKLLVDSTLVWAKAYKVDGFRFDLMGHHMVANMTKLRDALRALTLEKDGVDGSKIYLYGEGWNFGEVANGARGLNATQANMAGTGIGTFNDRLRDAARGGGPFSGLQEQGFASGLLSSPNGTDQGKADAQKTKLLNYMDWIRVGLAGNLKDYSFVDNTGKTVTGGQVDYNGQPAGYTADPQENINYVEAHDNETLFDAIAFKAPANTTIQDRVRMQELANDLVSLGQGIPFFHAGTDMLRSKSLDRDSYNSSDWFNRLDFTYQSNNFGVGLPPKDKNEANWPIMRTTLANTTIKPAQADIMQSVMHMQEMLQIRKSSKLFRLETGEAVKNQVKFLNTGKDQVPGLIVMSLADTAAKLDPNYRRIMVVFNATNQAQTFADKTMTGLNMSLHPVQVKSADKIVQTASFNPTTGAFNVPARTTAVFVEPYAGVASGGGQGGGSQPTTGATGSQPTTGATGSQPATGAGNANLPAGTPPLGFGGTDSHTNNWQISLGLLMGLVSLASLGLYARRRNVSK